MIKIKIIFATYNSEKHIRKVLDAYTKQQAPDINWELIVVNNASSDKTLNILSLYKDLLPITILNQNTPGKNKSLNYAISTLNHEDNDLYIITDDDAIPDIDFIKAWSKVVNSVTEADIFGGIIKLYFENGVPDNFNLFKQHSSVLWAEHTDIKESCYINPYQVYGPNMAVKPHLFTKGAMFNEDIGPNSSIKLYPMGSETEFCERIGKEYNLKFWFNCEAIVSHIVREYQTSLNFINARANRCGRGVALREKLENKGLKNTYKFILVLRAIKNKIRGTMGDCNANWNYNYLMGYLSDKFK